VAVREFTGAIKCPGEAGRALMNSVFLGGTGMMARVKKRCLRRGSLIRSADLLSPSSCVVSTYGTYIPFVST